MITHDAKAAAANVPENVVKNEQMQPEAKSWHEERLNMLELFLQHHFPKEYIAFFGKDEY